MSAPGSGRRQAPKGCRRAALGRAPPGRAIFAKWAGCAAPAGGCLLFFPMPPPSGASDEPEHDEVHALKNRLSELEERLNMVQPKHSNEAE